MHRARPLGDLTRCRRRDANLLVTIVVGVMVMLVIV
jgi:hypothetical protein